MDQEWAICVAIVVVIYASLWKIFVKAGEKGWKAIIPIYNDYIQLKIVGLSGWYLLLYLIPIVNIAISIYVAYLLAKSFGYGIGITLLSIIGIGFIIMGFGDAKYRGPNGQSKTQA